MNKKAISPLMATLVLISFSVGLGAVVMKWGQTYIEERAEFVQGVKETISSCNSVSFNIIRVEGISQICYKGNTIELYIDNGPDINLVDIHARVVGTEGVSTQESLLNAPLKKADAVRTAFAFTNIGEVRQVKLTPKINIAGEIVFCSQDALIIENIRGC